MTYQKSLQKIHNQIKQSGKESNIDERIELINELLPDGVVSEDHLMNEIIEHVSSEGWRLQQGRKRKKHQRYEETYLAKGLEFVADFILDKWHEYEFRNEELNDYTVQSQYDLKRIANNKKHKRVLGLNGAVTDDYLENTPSQSVLEGWEFHVDQFEKYSSRADDIFEFSEADKRKARNQLVQDNLDNPLLKERFIVYKELGIRYGFDKDLTKEEKEQKKQMWIDYFEQDKNNPISPKDRYYRLNKMYNKIGYELYIMQQNLIEPVEPKRSNQPLQRTDILNEKDSDLILGMVDLGEPQHVNGLLTIEKIEKRTKSKKRTLEYFPIFIALDNKHKDNDLSKFNDIKTGLLEAIKKADSSEVMSAMDKDIVELIINTHNNFNIYKDGIKVNPYKLLTEYINNKYRTKKTKGDIVRMVKGRISKVIADTYRDLEDGKIKQCTSCEVEKVHSAFGDDKRNKKDGKKSVCKKCASEAEKARKQIS